MRRFSLLCFAIIALTACSAPSGDEVLAPETLALPLESISITTSFDMTIDVMDTAVVPNTVASWLSQLIIVGKDGNLYRTSLNPPQVQLIQKGDFVSALSIKRDKQPGIFFAKTRDNRISGFIESNDESDFRAIVVSAEAFGQFCSDKTPHEDFFYAYSVEGELNKYTVTIDNQAAVITRSNSEALDDHLCPEASIRINPTGPNILLGIPPTRQIELANGLSQSGIADPDYVAILPVPMGAALNTGVVLATNHEENRAAVVALDYFNDVIKP